ncbi:TPA: DUF1642 domain-containing protein [Streptococcus pneumoniae]|nr:DUF1642 domain-containing protein [Streptococcus pneumoniae]HEW1158281.1 DUF1642 domain-containing protein [Streptococcus pneumoniae]HEW2516519.1 DUF1642 domain-containing protein [Streptococcus pneumoniae]HEW2537540.1 DUF1642 domain-containing protein [Streptococcus pneumoniae]
MNKQELIKEFREVGIYSLNIFGTEIKAIPTEIAITSIEQLDEPEKVKVPQFVADWITHSKNIGRSLFGAMSIFEENTEIKKWLQWADNQETFALAWIFGYEVEEEKRYLVKIKGNIKENMLVYGELLERYYFTKSLSLDNAIYSHTRKELEEAGFGWVFDCPGVEIEEVE